MGCGRSTLGSDSPKKSKKKAVESELSSDDNSSTSNNSNSGSNRKQHRNQQQQVINKLTPVGTGPLRAQAKISSSQQNFFMMLDQKIEMGPDYESEEEEVDRYRRFHEYAEQWHLLTHPRQTSPTTPPTPPMRYPVDENTCGSGNITEDDEDDDGLSEPECIPDEAVREQYMFMGNLYTLTHIRTDADKTEPKVDIEIPPKPDKVVEDGYKFNGSAISEDNVASQESEVVNKDSNSDKQGSRPVSRSSTSPRPASLILRSVFPVETTPE
ncbi:uncharacterized protein LOC135223682 isoform X1 [Macrobrachium nipponense]|uniref:uncharacterized protein LOC135223682 isoform X1 n=1 Tax=Macrobrachium nipponense TaxID=159736 RepID=UPI0030C7DC1D